MLRTGSMLKMLANLEGEATDIDWRNCAMAFVSHRSLSTLLPKLSGDRVPL